jgi:hypothetical protein
MEPEGTRQAMQFTINGTAVDLTHERVEASLAGHQPDRVRQYWIEVAGEVWPVKQVLRLATRVDGFQSQTAQRILRRLDFTVHNAPSGQPDRSTAQQTGFDVSALPTASALTSHVPFDWHLAGPVELDHTRRPRFPTVPNLPGLYRIDFDPDASTGRRTVYIGESTSLRRRTSNYRNAVNDAGAVVGHTDTLPIA